LRLIIDLTLTPRANTAFKIDKIVVPGRFHPAAEPISAGDHDMIEQFFRVDWRGVARKYQSYST